MQAPNVNELDLSRTLERSEVTTGVLRVIYALQEVDDYTKEEASEELIKVLNYSGYLQDIESRKRKSI